MEYTFFLILFFFPSFLKKLGRNTLKEHIPTTAPSNTKANVASELHRVSSNKETDLHAAKRKETARAGEGGVVYRLLLNRQNDFDEK